MVLDVVDSILQVTVAFSQVHLQQVTQQVFQVRAEVGWEAHLEKEKQQHFKTKNYDNWENYIRGIPGTIRPCMRGC